MPQGLCCRGYAPGAMLQEPWMMADEDEDDDDDDDDNDDDDDDDAK